VNLGKLLILTNEEKFSFRRVKGEIGSNPMRDYVPEYFMKLYLNQYLMEYVSHSYGIVTKAG